VALIKAATMARRLADGPSIVPRSLCGTPNSGAKCLIMCLMKS
jgi:hypothetical protein